MGCPGENELQNLLNGILQPDKEAEMRGHIDGCEKCRSRYEALARVDGLLRDMEGATPGEAYWDSLSERTAARLDKPGAGGMVRRLPARHRLGRVFWWLTEAAAVFCIVCTLSFFFSPQPSGEKAPPAPRTAVRVEVDFDDEMGELVVTYLNQHYPDQSSLVYDELEGICIDTAITVIY